MNLEQLIKHPEMMDGETLYDLRSLLALYPYYQTARLLLLQNLYLLHDPLFDEELRRSAVFLTDRNVVFNLVEAVHYKLQMESAMDATTGKKAEEDGSRTITLIDKFLNDIPVEENGAPDETKTAKRKPTPTDATVDYVSYLLETESNEANNSDTPERTQMKGQELIDNFINNDNGKIELKETPTYVPEMAETDRKNAEESYFTETLAQIYIKQERYDKALEIIKRLNLNYQKKNVYFADQIRFLEKLIINNKYK